MFLGFSVNKCRKRLQGLYKLIEKKNDLYDELIEKSQCINCENYNNKSVKILSDRFINCGECTKKEKITRICDEMQDIENETDSFIENTYAPIVYEALKKKNPQIRNIVSKEVGYFNDIYSSGFGQINKKDKYNIIGIVEETGEYRIN